jgi:hypothetical protein
MLSPDSLLEQLHRNESSFYTVLLNAKSNPTIENFVILSRV